MCVCVCCVCVCVFPCGGDEEEDKKRCLSLSRSLCVVCLSSHPPVPCSVCNDGQESNPRAPHSSPNGMQRQHHHTHHTHTHTHTITAQNNTTARRTESIILQYYMLMCIKWTVHLKMKIVIIYSSSSISKPV